MMASRIDDPDGVPAVVGVSFAQGLSSSGSVLVDMFLCDDPQLVRAARLRVYGCMSLSIWLCDTITEVGMKKVVGRRKVASSDLFEFEC